MNSIITPQGLMSKKAAATAIIILQGPLSSTATCMSYPQDQSSTGIGTMGLTELGATPTMFTTITIMIAATLVQLLGLCWRTQGWRSSRASWPPLPAATSLR